VSALLDAIYNIIHTLTNLPIPKELPNENVGLKEKQSMKKVVKMQENRYKKPQKQQHKIKYHKVQKRG